MRLQEKSEFFHSRQVSRGRFARTGAVSTPVNYKSGGLSQFWTVDCKCSVFSWLIHGWFQVYSSWNPRDQLNPQVYVYSVDKERKRGRRTAENFLEPVQNLRRLGKPPRSHSLSVRSCQKREKPFTAQGLAQ